MLLRVAFVVLATVVAFGCARRSDRSSQVTADTTRAAGRPVNIKFADIRWNRFAPEIGADSPEIAILHVDSAAHATKLMIRVPSGFTVPAHWHSANETHTIVDGTFILECEGVRDTLSKGSFNYVPKRMVHRAWTRDDEGVLLFITTDGPWDVNFVDGPPDWSTLRKRTLSKRGG